MNKSFKFQSEWPYNNSQSYLLNNLLNDINNDSNYNFEIVDNGYIITTKVNYSNNKELVKQKIYINKDKDIFMVEVLDSSEIVKMKMNIDKIDYNCSFDDNYFSLENNMTVSSEVNLSTSKIDDIIYPMYIPKNTYLSSQNKVSLEKGERVIMTFAGDYPFMLIQETINNSDAPVLSVSGDPLQLSSSIGIIDDSSITWIDDNTLYYLVSNTLDHDELIDVANSLTVASIEK